MVAFEGQTVDKHRMLQNIMEGENERFRKCIDKAAFLPIHYTSAPAILENPLFFLSLHSFNKMNLNEICYSGEGRKVTQNRALL